MARFLVRRIFQGVLVLWLVTVGVFVIFYVGPGRGRSRARWRASSATPRVVAAVSHRLLLDRPIWRAVLATSCGCCCTATSGTPTTRPVGQLGARRGVPDHPFLVLGAADPVGRRSACSPGCMSAVRPGPVADRTFTVPGAVLLLDAHLRPRPAVLLFFYYELTIHGIHASPGPGTVSFTTNPVQWFRSADPALAHAGAGVRGHLYPADPGVDAGRDGRGLHPHRPGQRPVRAAGHLPALAARGADTGRHPVRPRRRDPARRRRSSPSRSSACPASASPPCRRSPAGPADHHRRGHRRRGRGRGGQHRGRRVLSPCSTRGSGCTDLRSRPPGRAAADHARIAHPGEPVHSLTP